MASDQPNRQPAQSTNPQAAAQLRRARREAQENRALQQQAMQGSSSASADATKLRVAQESSSASADVVYEKVEVSKGLPVQQHQDELSEATPSFNLPAAIYSPQLLESVVYDIQFYLDWIRQNQIRKTVGAHPKDEPTHSAETALVIEAWLAGRPATLASIEALLDYLKNLNLPEVHLMMAALPNRTQREALVTWFRNNTTPHLFISFVADRNLGGGVVVRTPNRVFDYSWKQALVSGRDKLAGIIKRV